MVGQSTPCRCARSKCSGVNNGRFIKFSTVRIYRNYLESRPHSIIDCGRLVVSIDVSRDKKGEISEKINRKF